MRKGLVILLSILLAVTSMILPVMAEDTVLGMVGRTFTASNETVLPYRIYAPTTDAPENGFAVYMHFHGVGECGSDNVAQTSTGMELVRKIISQKGTDAIVLVPQCEVGYQWVNVPFAQGTYNADEVALSTYLAAAMELLESVKSQYKVDENRLYLGGLSMGGYAVWDLLARYPDTFAAAIPVCGGGDPTKAANMADVAIRTYHSADDPIVPVSGTRAMVEALEKVGGNITYREFTNLSHSCWSRAFNMPDQVTWLFSQSRKAEEQEPQQPQEPQEPQQPQWEQGDVNEDNSIDAKDALQVLNFAVNKTQLTAAQQERADVNLDEAINAKDALEILKYAVGKINGFPQREPVLSPPETVVTPTAPPVDQPENPPAEETPTDTSTGEIL